MHNSQSEAGLTVDNSPEWWILTLVPCHSEREMEIGNEKTGNGNDDGCEEEEVTFNSERSEAIPGFN